MSYPNIKKVTVTGTNGKSTTSKLLYDILKDHGKDVRLTGNIGNPTLLEKNLNNNKINSEDITIKLLCYPRLWGYVFNPLSIFFVYDKNSNLVSILYEVKNTFGEQHTYVFKIDKNNKLFEHSCKKKFHVSPFIEMDCTYFFKITKPGKNILVYIDQYDNEDKLLVALQEGVKVNLNNKNLIKNYFFHPLMSFKIILAIHFEAFRLWIKGIKHVEKKRKIKNNTSLEN